jgi:hypothetical protein
MFVTEVVHDRRVVDRQLLDDGRRNHRLSAASTPGDPEHTGLLALCRRQKFLSAQDPRAGGTTRLGQHEALSKGLSMISKRITPFKVLVEKPVLIETALLQQALPDERLAQCCRYDLFV